MFKATASGLLKFTTTKIPSSAYLVICMVLKGNRGKDVQGGRLCHG